MTTLTFGSLFSGIGGLDLGLERAGMTCLWQSEIDPYACRVLAKHWPDTPNLGDIRDINWRTVPTVDIVAGGYPCQPFSHAGVRQGEEDPRHLWPMFANCIRILRPRYALMENVSGHLSLGFGPVLADLATLGYDARWDCIPAAAVGAPHLRDRVFIIATRRRPVAHTTSTPSERRCIPSRRDTQHTEPDMAGSQWPSPIPHPSKWRQQGPGRTEHTNDQTTNQQRQTDQPVHDCHWTTEPRVGRVANGVPSGMDRLRGLGNAVVPQVAQHVAQIILNHHNHNQ